MYAKIPIDEDRELKQTEDWKEWTERETAKQREEETAIYNKLCTVCRRSQTGVLIKLHCNNKQTSKLTLTPTIQHI